MNLRVKKSVYGVQRNLKGFCHSAVRLYTLFSSFIIFFDGLLNFTLLHDNHKLVISRKPDQEIIAVSKRDGEPSILDWIYGYAMMFYGVLGTLGVLEKRGYLSEWFGVLHVSFSFIIMIIISKYTVSEQYFEANIFFFFMTVQMVANSWLMKCAVLEADGDIKIEATVQRKKTEPKEITITTTTTTTTTRREEKNMIPKPRRVIVTMDPLKPETIPLAIKYALVVSQLNPGKAMIRSRYENGEEKLLPVPFKPDTIVVVPAPENGVPVPLLPAYLTTESEIRQQPATRFTGAAATAKPTEKEEALATV